MDFKVFTLNCWGIPVVSKDRRERMQAIAEFLALNQYDVVCLQEVWTTKDFNLIKEKCSGILPYAHYFYSGVVGSGICILSRHPFQDVFFHQWSVNGYVHKLQHGDWFGGKGVGLCKLKVNGFNINVYSAHLHAEYNRNDDEYKAHRVLQAYDTAQFIELTSSSSDLIILAGDLNTEPGDLAYRILLTMTNFKDSFAQQQEMSASQQSSGILTSTNESLENSYTPKKLIKQQIQGKRIDYIIYGTKTQEKNNIKLMKYSQPMPTRVPHCSYSYSDHEAVSISLKLSLKNQEDDQKNDHKENLNQNSENDEKNIKIAVLKECIEIFEDALKKLKYHQQIYLLFSGILFVLLLGSIALDPPYGIYLLLHLIRIILTIFFCFCFIMGTLWNKIERNGVLAGKLAMEVNLLVKERAHERGKIQEEF